MKFERRNQQSRPNPAIATTWTSFTILDAIFLFFFFSFPFFPSFFPSFFSTPFDRSSTRNAEWEAFDSDIYRTIVSRFFSSFYSPCIRSSFFFIFVRANLVSRARERIYWFSRGREGLKIDIYYIYIYVKSYFSREIRGLRCTYRIVFLSFSSSLSFFFVQLHVRYHGCIKIFNFIQTDAAIRF